MYVGILMQIIAYFDDGEKSREIYRRRDRKHTLIGSFVRIYVCGNASYLKSSACSAISARVCICVPMSIQMDSVASKPSTVRCGCGLPHQKSRRKPT